MESKNIAGEYGKLLKAVPKPLLDSLVGGDVIPFVGAGFSKNCDGTDGFDMPDWSNLGAAIAGSMPDYDYDGNPIEALSTYEERFKRAALVELLRKICMVSKIRPGDAHRLLCGCFQGVICTTNFDFLIEDALQELHIGRHIVTAEDCLTLSNVDCTTVVKVHGDFNHPRRMVVTERDYDLFIHENPLLCTYISNLFITKTMLLIGYSLDDCDLRQLLQIVKNRLGSMARPVYCIQVGVSKETIDRYKRRGVDVINIPRRRGESYKDVLVEFLRQLKAYKDGESAKKVTGSDEDIREQLIQPVEKSRLCFVSCERNRVAGLKKLLEPVIRECGAVPVWPENVMPEGVDIKAAMSATIRKSAARIFDISESSGHTQFELGISLADSEEKTIVIMDDECKIPSDLMNGIQCLRYSSDVNHRDDEIKNEDFRSKLIQLIKPLLPLGDDQSFSLAEPKRLYEAAAYDAAVVVAWIEIERYLRMNLGIQKVPIASILVERCGGSPKVADAVYGLRNIRNKIVHGIVSVGQKEAERAIKDAEFLLQLLKRGR